MGHRLPNISSPRVRTVTGDMMRRRHIGNFTRQVITAGQRQRIEGTTKGRYIQRFAFSIFAHTSGILYMVIILFGTDYSHRSIQIRSSVFDQRTGLFNRSFMHPATGLSFPYTNVNLTLFIGDRCRSYHAMTARRFHIVSGNISALFRQSEIGGTFTLSALRAFFGGIPF